MAAAGLIEMEGSTKWTSDLMEEEARSADVHPICSTLGLGSTSDPLWNGNQNFGNFPSVPPSLRSDARSTISTVRRNSLTSQFYCNPNECQTECCHGASEAAGHTSTFSVKQSSQLPVWLWLFLARCLRVPLPGRGSCRFIPSVGLLLQGIRRFITELEADAVNYEMCYAKQYYSSPMTAEDICQESIWIENKMSASGSYVPDDCYSQGSSRRHVQLRSCEDGPCISVLSGNYDADITRSADLSVATSRAPRSLSIAEILHVYWKVLCRLRLTGQALQRWVGSLIALVVFWCSSQLVTWLNHSPTVWEVVQFVCPLTLLLVITSSIAEVNLEGSRMIKCIRPTEERLAMMNFLLKAPIQLSTFGFSLSYGTIMTVVFGVLMAFASKLIIVEIQANTG
ncbi:uncharacterized protein [Dermacentor albipictus]|uniref:uncharacterized protein isoform X5 n=1 Tax=Dermacentor albipictus TaxID=60249 RepID=UPI0031FCF715